MAKGLALLLGEAMGGHSEKEEAAKDLIDAVKDGDAKAAALAFESLYELCAKGSDEGDGDEDEDDESYGG